MSAVPGESAPGKYTPKGSVSAPISLGRQDYISVLLRLVGMEHVYSWSRTYTVSTSQGYSAGQLYCVERGGDDSVGHIAWVVAESYHRRSS